MGKYKESFGDRLLRERKALNLSQRAASAEMDFEISHSQLSQYERNVLLDRMCVRHLITLSDAYDWPINDMVASLEESCR